jgi:hypothetical protein
MHPSALVVVAILCLGAAPASAQREVRINHDPDGLYYTGAGADRDVSTLQELEFALEYDPDLIEITELVPAWVLADNPPDRLQIDYLPGRVEVSLGYDEPLALGPHDSTTRGLFSVSRNLPGELYAGERVAVRTVGLDPGVPPSWIDDVGNPDDIKIFVQDLVILGDGLTCLAGDALGDGEVDAGDSGTVLRIVTGLIESPEASVRCGADFNGDGYIYAGDGVLILRRAAGFDDSVPRIAPVPEVELTESGSGARVRVSGAGFAHGATLRVRSVGALGLRAVEANVSGLDASRVQGDEAVLALADIVPLTLDVLEFEVSVEGVGRLVVEQLSLYGADGDAFFEQGEPLVLDLSGPPVVAGLALSSSPNPFNPSTTFWMDLPREGRVMLELYDMRGRRLATLLDEVRPAGRSPFSFDAKSMSSGVYFARLKSAAGVAVRRITLLK